MTVIILLHPDADSVKVQVVQVDLDIDSDNSNAIDLQTVEFGYEDQIEDIKGKPAFPGKFVAVNNGDADNDGIPNFADGFQTNDFDNSGANAGGAFTPIRLHVPEPVDMSTVRFRFTYSASDPYQTARTGAGTPADPHIYSPATGDLRLWTKDGTESRNAKSVTVNGDYIPSRTSDGNSMVLVEYTADQLGFPSGNRTLPLYIEGIRPSAAVADQQITVEIDPDGDGPAGWVHADAVRVTVVAVDLDIDSDNNNELADPERSDKEEALEDFPGHPGKALALNELDRRKNGIPDFADGYDLSFGDQGPQPQSVPDASHKFVPVILQFSKAVDLTKATIRFKSDPGKNLNAIADPANVNVSRTGTGESIIPGVDDPFKYKYEVPGNDKVRLWTKDGDQARLKAPVPTGNAILKDTLIKVSDLNPDADGRVTLYLEAIAKSTSLGDVGIRVELDPTGATEPGKFKGIAGDQVKATVFHIKEVHPLAADFTSGHKGKIMISAKHGGGYYTPAQTDPGKVAITAHVEPLPPDWYSGLKVYFEVTDPDDLSHYEGKTTPGSPATQGDTNPNDNRDPNRRMTWNNGAPAGYPAYQTACLEESGPGRSVVPGYIEINGTIIRCVAATTLTITDQFAGDNYQVRASMQKPHNDEPFDTLSGMTAGMPLTESTVKQSEIMIAWKRVYIEQDCMYKKGATIIESAPAGSTELEIDSCADFNAGDQVVVFWKGGSEIVTVLEKLPSPVRFIYMTKGGSGYSYDGGIPNVTIDPPGGEGGVQAEATPFIENGRISVAWIVPGEDLVAGGSGYTTVPSITIDPPGTPGGVQAEAKATIGRLRISPLANSIPEYAGIRPVTEPGTHELDRRYLANAFGSKPNGSPVDSIICQGFVAGAFIEFLDVPENPNPKTPKFTAPTGSHFDEYNSYWFDNKAHNQNNVLYLLAANLYERRNAGIATSMYNETPGIRSQCVVFDGAITIKAIRDETVVHEIGHRFDLVPATFPYVDTHSDVLNHAGLDKCIMNYNKHSGNGTAEFSIEALLDNGTYPGLRDQKDQ